MWSLRRRVNEVCETLVSHLLSLFNPDPPSCSCFHRQDSKNSLERSDLWSRWSDSNSHDNTKWDNAVVMVTTTRTWNQQRSIRFIQTLMQHMRLWCIFVTDTAIYCRLSNRKRLIFSGTLHSSIADYPNCYEAIYMQALRHYRLHKFKNARPGWIPNNNRSYISINAVATTRVQVNLYHNVVVIWPWYLLHYL